MSTTSLRRRLKHSVAALAAVALVGTLSACGGDEEKSEARAAHPEWADLTLTIAEQSDGIKSLIDASGAFDDAAYDIEFAKFEYGPPLVAAAGSGDVDLGMVGAVPPLAGLSGGQKIKVIGKQVPSNPDLANDNIIVPKGSSITKIEDLKGKKLAVPQGSSAHGVALGALKSVGLTPDDVELVYLAPKEASAAFDSGKVDAWSIWQPQAGLAIDKGATVIAEGKPPIYPGTLYYVASEKQLADADRKSAIADALNRIAEAYAWGNDNPDEHVIALSKDTGLPEEQVKKSLENWEYDFEPIDDAHLALYQELADNFVEAGEIPQAVDVTTVVEDLYDPEFTH